MSFPGSSETGAEVKAGIEVGGIEVARLLLGAGEEEVVVVEEVETETLKTPGKGGAEGLAPSFLFVVRTN